jgi:peptidoglycan L-alanyl-D-glutamate endopeptidase CwlK
MDTASINKLQQMHPHIKVQVAAVAAYMEACQCTPVNQHPYIVETLSSFEVSEHDYQLGRTLKNPEGIDEHHPMGEMISNAKAGQSYHNYGLALDIMIKIKGEQEPVFPTPLVVGIFEKHGFTWGGNFEGNFKDEPHFENKMGHTWRQLLSMYEAKQFIKGTNYLII